MPGDSLMPQTGLQRAAADAAFEEGRHFKSACLDLISGPGARCWGVGSNATPQQISAFEAACGDVSKHVRAAGGPFLAGATVSIADFQLWPFMERVLICAKEFSGYDAASATPEMEAWVAAMQVLPAVQMAQADKKAFLAVLHQHSSLDWFDYVPCGVYELHPHLLPASSG